MRNRRDRYAGTVAGKEHAVRAARLGEGLPAEQAADPAVTVRTRRSMPVA
jgi:hypothetical protein